MLLSTMRTREGISHHLPNDARVQYSRMKLIIPSDERDTPQTRRWLTFLRSKRAHKSVDRRPLEEEDEKEEFDLVLEKIVISHCSPTFSQGRVVITCQITYNRPIHQFRRLQVMGVATDLCHSYSRQPRTTCHVVAKRVKRSCEKRTPIIQR